MDPDQFDAEDLSGMTLVELAVLGAWKAGKKMLGTNEQNER